jgi:hypothetical protein
MVSNIPIVICYLTKYLPVTRHSSEQIPINGGFNEKLISGWWFGTFFIFPYIGNNNPN